MHGVSKELIEQLRSDHESVLIEANDLSVRNDELKTARNSDKGIIRDLNSQIQVYKRKYEQAETELHSATGAPSRFSVRGGAVR
jgi:hypothetical protein